MAHAILAERPADDAPLRAASQDGPLVVELCDQFLDWVGKHKAPLTYETYRRRLQHLLDDLRAHGDSPAERQPAKTGIAWNVGAHRSSRPPSRT